MHGSSSSSCFASASRSDFTFLRSAGGMGPVGFLPSGLWSAKRTAFSRSGSSKTTSLLLGHGPSRFLRGFTSAEAVVLAAGGGGGAGFADTVSLVAVSLGSSQALVASTAMAIRRKRRIGSGPLPHQRLRLLAAEDETEDREE